MREVSSSQSRRADREGGESIQLSPTAPADLAPDHERDGAELHQSA